MFEVEVSGSDYRSIVDFSSHSLCQQHFHEAELPARRPSWLGNQTNLSDVEKFSNNQNTYHQKVALCSISGIFQQHPQHSVVQVSGILSPHEHYSALKIADESEHINDN